MVTDPAARPGEPAKKCLLPNCHVWCDDQIAHLVNYHDLPKWVVPALRDLQARVSELERSEKEGWAVAKEALPLERARAEKAEERAERAEAEAKENYHFLTVANETTERVKKERDAARAAHLTCDQRLSVAKSLQAVAEQNHKSAAYAAEGNLRLWREARAEAEMHKRELVEMLPKLHAKEREADALRGALHEHHHGEMKGVKVQPYWKDTMGKDGPYCLACNLPINEAALAGTAKARGEAATTGVQAHDADGLLWPKAREVSPAAEPPESGRNYDAGWGPEPDDDPKPSPAPPEACPTLWRCERCHLAIVAHPDEPLRTFCVCGADMWERVGPACPSAKGAK